MTYRWRPRPSWLKKVHFNANPVPSAKKPPELKVYWGHFTPLSWQDLLDAAEASRGEPHLLHLSATQKQKLHANRHNFKSMSWAELVGKSPKPVLEVTASVSWKDLVREPTQTSMEASKNELGLCEAITWTDLLGDA